MAVLEMLGFRINKTKITISIISILSLIKYMFFGKRKALGLEKKSKL
jgi:hypothetical protein